MKTFFQLAKNLKKDVSHLTRIRVAVLGDSATQFLVQALKGTGFECGFDLQIWEAEFDQIERQVFDQGSEFYLSKPEIVVLFQSSQKLLKRFSQLSAVRHGTFAQEHIESVRSIYATIRERLDAKVIYYNFTEINDSVFGNFANKIEISFLFQLRKVNWDLMNFAAKNPEFHICDLSSIQNQMGRSACFQSPLYVNTEMVLSLDVLPFVAQRTLDLISALGGRFKKCLILDLDNTVWGGVIGDDGMESIQVGALGIGKAFTDFQYWVKKLKERGIIIAVCSKNTEAVAKEPFEKHPDMVLRLGDIAVFIANWENKVDNIRRIQAVLNIGFDSMVFLDDNPFERNMVRENIPAVTVPELPEDPAEYLEFLYQLNLFETVSFSADDSARTRQYQIEGQRVLAQEKFASEDEFLASLGMVSAVEPFAKFNTPRVAQLSQRSNQFNLRTVRYSESDLEAMSRDGNCHNFSFTLEDKFGDNGLICAVVLRREDLETLFIESWFMSCRVLKRGMEEFVLNTIASHARELGFRRLKGEYRATPKNDLVREHYRQLGFEKSGEYWLLDVQEYQNRKCFIRTKNQIEERNAKNHGQN